ncbi:MAG: hypothetical protein OXQ84_18630 [bacterium]|nr:hypothetical protein [bacterium]
MRRLSNPNLWQQRGNGRGVHAREYIVLDLLEDELGRTYGCCHSWRVPVF